MTAQLTPQTFWKLTQRWQPLRFHPVQSRLWHQPIRFKTIHAGRRSGKTELGKRKLVDSLRMAYVTPKSWRDQRFFAAAPTRNQAKKIFWGDLKALTPRNWIKRIYDGDLIIITRWGAELHVVGLDKPDRIEGPGWDGGVISEFASCKAGIFDANVRPALADRQGWLWLEGVPDFAGPSQAEYEEFCDLGRLGTDPEWGDYTWNSADILAPTEIASMKRRMGFRLFDQETGGKFVLAGGMAFAEFDDATHVKDEWTEYDPSLPICWSLDFNWNPQCSGILQHRNGQVCVIDEIEIASSSIDVVCATFIERAKANGWNLANLVVYGDASGEQHKSVSSYTDWMKVRNWLKNYEPVYKVPRANPPLRDTINSVGAKLKAADGSVNLYLNSRCKRLRSDLRTAIWPSDLREQHALAWLRYMVDREYPVRIESAAEPGEFQTT